MFSMLPETRACPKCGGAMAPGFLQQFHARSNFPPHQFAPLSDLSAGVFGAQAQRFELLMYLCLACGFVEWYGTPSYR